MTPFGKAMINLRIDYEMTLRAMSQKMEKSPAYISAVEHGNKGRPSEKFLDGVCGALGLSGEQRNKLKEAAEKSSPVLRIKNVGKPASYEIANLLVKRGQSHARPAPFLLDPTTRLYRSIACVG